MLELYLIRHGESIRNVACLLAHQGSEHVLEEQLRHASTEALVPLTDKGRVQALLAGKWIAEQAECIDALYCSPYLRAWETARRMHLGREIGFDDRLREREWGMFGPGEYSAAEYVADLCECSELGWRSRFPGGESISDLVPATADFLEEVRRKHAGGRIAVVTHGGRMQAFEHVIEQSRTPRKYANCAVLHYRFEPDATFVRVDFPAQTELTPIAWQNVWEPVRIRA